MHIADIDFAEFYAPAFPCLADSQGFYASVESLDGPAKIALHQGARMLWLADRMGEVARGRDSLQILFYLIAAEAVAKIVFGFKGERESRKYVKRFFREISTEQHRTRLSQAFEQRPFGWLTWEKAVDKLYEVRCDVVHEGQYFTFGLKDSRISTPMLADLKRLNGPMLVAHVSSPELRQLVLEGIVEGAKKCLRPCSRSVG